MQVMPNGDIVQCGHLPNTAKNTLYKTELCKHFAESGTCRYGHKCQFAHGEHELRSVLRHPKYKTTKCKVYSSIGQCPYGSRCRFLHDDRELITSTRYFQLSYEQNGVTKGVPLWVGFNPSDQAGSTMPPLVPQAPLVERTDVSLEKKDERVTNDDEQKKAATPSIPSTLDDLSPGLMSYNISSSGIYESNNLFAPGSYLSFPMASPAPSPLENPVDSPSLSALTPEENDSKEKVESNQDAESSKHFAFSAHTKTSLRSSEELFKMPSDTPIGSASNSPLLTGRQRFSDEVWGTPEKSIFMNKIPAAGRDSNNNNNNDDDDDEEESNQESNNSIDSISFGLGNLAVSGGSDVLDVFKLPPPALDTFKYDSNPAQQEEEEDNQASNDDSGPEDASKSEKPRLPFFQNFCSETA